jgi:hypothetical protein
MAIEGRIERLQIMLTDEELAAVDDWRFSRRMPSRAAAVRELLKRGLAAEGFALANKSTKSKEFGILTRTKLERAISPHEAPTGEIHPPKK